MSNKRSRSLKEKVEILNAYESGNHSLSELYDLYNVYPSSIKDWKYKYERYGIEGLKESNTWNKYSKELKLAAIKDYESGNYSLRQVVRKYEISDAKVLRDWIKKYNGHREIKSAGKGRNHSMTKGRSTSWKERIDIVYYCLSVDKNYQETAVKYKVSYQQVYQWVRKYESGGIDALKDRRGRNKTEEELTPEEKMKLEIKRIAKENERLRAENAFLKKLGGNRKEAVLSKVRQEHKYLAIKELNENEGFNISLLCEIAVIARSAYYKWDKRIPSPEERLNEKILEEIKELHKKHDGILGYRRMTLYINRLFKNSYNKKRIRRIMKIAGIESVIRRKKNRYVKSTPQHVAENTLNRDFTAEKPNQKWVTDVTEFKYGHSKKAYLSAILDLYDNTIVSYVVGHSNNNQLVFETLDNAIQTLSATKPLIHSDRGYQYTSYPFKRKIDEAKMTQSMSRVGKCIDNGPIEAFWGTIKCEKYYLNKYDTFEELVKAIDEYIYFFNYERLQERLNGLSPMEFRAKAA
ncbi:IS3 family transposase [Pseudogracilibacillus sp. SE30717A]|uniref:IS3 family transposase n=1 Tax=Pseudogracilibacillus sp. SE30717A TaxID=3098293 RepID=UPI00300E3850